MLTLTHEPFTWSLTIVSTHARSSLVRCPSPAPEQPGSDSRFTTRPNTPVGSIKPKSKSVSLSANALGRGACHPCPPYAPNATLGIAESTASASKSTGRSPASTPANVFHHHCSNYLSGRATQITTYAENGKSARIGPTGCVSLDVDYEVYLRLVGISAQRFGTDSLGYCLSSNRRTTQAACDRLLNMGTRRVRCAHDKSHALAYSTATAGGAGVDLRRISWALCGVRERPGLS